MRDWVQWHELYKSNLPLRIRLKLVQSQLKRALNKASDGPVTILSLFAGDARDLSGVLSRHARAKDVSAYLIECNSDLVEAGRKKFDDLGLGDQVDFRVADATDPTSYDGIPPADIVLVCGMLGFVTSETTLDLVRALRSYLKPDGHLIWTRNLMLRNGADHTNLFQTLLSENEFDQKRLSKTALPFFQKKEDPVFVVGTHQYIGSTLSVPNGPFFAVNDL